MLYLSILYVIMQSYLKWSFKLEQLLLFVLAHFQRLPEGVMFLTIVFKETNSVTSTASFNECLVLLLALDPEYLKLSLDEWI